MNARLRAVRDHLPQLAIELIFAAIIAYFGIRVWGWAIAVLCGLFAVGAIVWAIVHGFRDVRRGRAGNSRGAA